MKSLIKKSLISYIYLDLSFIHLYIFFFLILNIFFIVIELVCIILYNFHRFFINNIVKIAIVISRNYKI